MHYDVIITGAGAAGLIAAYDLSKAGKQVLILEARNRIGGRAYTVSGNNFSKPVETGAEFVHGKLPITLSLLKEAGLQYQPMEGKSYTIKKGKLTEDEDAGIDWQKLMKKLNSLTNDTTIESFLNTHFHDDKYKDLRDSVIRFVQGFDAADPARVSSFSLRKEWQQEDDEHQYRIEKGYTALMQWLADEAIASKANLQLSHIVKSINWHKETVTVVCANDKSFTASKTLIAVPISVWQNGNDASIQFTPPLPEKQLAASQISYGNVVKVNMEFLDKFWENNTNHKMPDAGFIFSDAIFPTWWTQNPGNEPQLSGWLAGPPADAFNQLTSNEIKEKAIESLAYIMRKDKQFIEQKLAACMVTSWSNNPFAKGAYSYDTLQSVVAKKILVQPVENTLFFAGEALYEGPNTGTVEAAFTSGRNAAKMIL